MEFDADGNLIEHDGDMDGEHDGDDQDDVTPVSTPGLSNGHGNKLVNGHTLALLEEGHDEDGLGLGIGGGGGR